MRIRNACCAVISDSQAELTLVHFLLEREFSEILEVATETAWPSLAQRNDVAVLLLAFTDLVAAAKFREWHAQRPEHGGAPAQVVLLCSREDVGAAYELCRSHDIFDYVMFWPVTHDPKRLSLAAHRACDAYETLVRNLPPAVTAADAQSADATTTVPAVSPPVRLPLPDLAVLVVEDDPFQLAIAISVLIASGLRATGAAGAQVALSLLESSAPALILLDVDMPDMDGMALLRRLKADPRHAAIPVIMLTMMRERDMVLEALRDGAADFIVKPFDRDTLLQKIRRVTALVT
jgi:CheY-like chemotaxis protein